MIELRTMHISLLAWGSIFSLVATVFMFLSRNFNKERKIWLTSLLVACALLLASDSLAYAYRGGADAVAYWIVRISNFAVFFVSDIIMFLFHGYVCNHLFANRVKKQNTLAKVRIYAVYALAVTGMVLVILSLLTGLYYTIDADNLYHRSSFFFISLIPPALGLLIDLSLIIQYRKNLTKDIFASLMIYITLPFAAEVIQAFHYGASYINISICISVIILFAVAVLNQNREIAIWEREASELKDSLKLAIEERESCYSAVAQIYLSMYLVDIRTGTYKAIKSTKSTESGNDTGPDNLFPAQAQYITEKFVTEQYKSAVGEFTDLSTLGDRLEGKNVIEHIFWSHTFGWCRGSFIRVDSDEEGNLRRALFCIEVIDEEKRRENYLQYLAETDIMTGLTNRGTGEKRVKELLGRAVGGAFCLIDCDNFKAVNDMYGHTAGDKVIVCIARCIKKTCSDKDIVFRLGGDEFAVYSMGLRSEAQVGDFTQKLFENMGKIRIPELGNEKISVSVGAAFSVGKRMSFDELYRQADIAMYESKKATGCKATVYRR